MGYASHNGLKTETYGNSLVHAITYNNRLQANEIKLGTAGNPTSILDITYNYGTTNNNGNLLSTSYAGGGLSYTQSFGYDALNRLTTSNENGGASWSQTNAYDRYGNRWIDLGGGNQSLYFNTANNRISGWSYDAVGNLLNDGVHTYTFDAENKISKVDNVVAYAYNGEGQRVRKFVGENTRFVYGLAGELIAEYSGANGLLLKEYVYGGGMVATIDATNGTQYTTADTLGSPRVVTNSSGSVVSRHDYMPFGVELGVGVGGRSTGMGYGVVDGNRQKFTGYERDSETGLDFAQARYYSSTQGRFTSADPLMASASPLRPQSWNRYAYSYNNPLKYTDPSGMFGKEVNDQSYRQKDRAMYGGLETAGEFQTFEQVTVWLGKEMIDEFTYETTGGFTLTDNEILRAEGFEPQDPRPTVDSEYQRCRNQVFGQGATGYGNKDIPGQHQTGLIFLAGRANVNDAAMIAAIWAKESNFAETPGGDAGPAQLTSWWKTNHPELIRDKAYGSWNGRTNKPFDGNVQDNIETLGNIVRFSYQRYGNYPAIAYWYGPGDPNNAKNAAKNRANYQADTMSRYAKYQEFFNCLPH